MDRQGTQYPSLEPSADYLDIQDFIDAADFDAPEITVNLFPPFDPPFDPPKPEAATTEPLHGHPYVSTSNAQNFGISPGLLTTAPPEFLHPTTINTPQGMPEALFQQQQGQATAYAVPNNGGTAMMNLYTPALSLPFSAPGSQPSHPVSHRPLQEPASDLNLLSAKGVHNISDPRRNSGNTSRFSTPSNASSQNLYRTTMNRPPSPHVLLLEPRLKRPEKGPNDIPLKNGRIPRVTRKNQLKPDPREWYGAPPPQPESWGPKDKNGRPLFKYTEHGELERGKAYTVRQLRWYLYGPNRRKGEDFELPSRLPGVPEVRGKVRQGLTLWIGWVPPQSNERFPFGSQSHKCRFADCEDSNRTIRTGLPLIAFDERMNEDGDAIDVFHNAGYAHLYCFERHFDLVDAMIRLDVRPDERSFKREDANLYKLSRQFPEIHNEIDLWWRDEYPKWLHSRETGEKRSREHKFSLNYRLVCHAIENGPEARAKMRDMRCGADISKHKGDLQIWRFLKECRQYNLVDEHGDPVPGAETKLTFIKECARYDLLDDYGAPVPDAEGKLKLLKEKGNSKKIGPKKAKYTKPSPRQPGHVPEPYHHPQQYRQANIYMPSYDTAFYNIPHSPLAPMPYIPQTSHLPQPLMYPTFSPPYHASYPTPPAQHVNQPTPYPPYVQQNFGSPLGMSSQRKRTRDEQPASDRKIGTRHYDAQIETGESPAKKLRQAPQSVPSPPASLADRPSPEITAEPNMEGYSDLVDPFGKLEENDPALNFSLADFSQPQHIELDEDTAFEIIDREVPDGKSSDGKNIDEIAASAAELGGEEGEGGKGGGVEEEISWDALDLDHDADLFGDAPEVTENAGKTGADEGSADPATQEVAVKEAAAKDEYPATASSKP
ncbi:hypothetical protein GGS23DRAFT_452191 [Durotheca rogersii]|uniref:uncharacterized protein n=1 Tax=Durotheca rogersii TaxID=419775 RepID=UPI00222126BE|nr:uncharacterized protein GGS23DRAFT_452191 [Durotheca rogersii]KAI5864538.1 hypothetical protein GGS23DRAFT_452191 [Durotheca rogersii]